MLALIAGRGSLPAEIIASQEAQGLPRPMVCALAGHLPDGAAPELSFRIEHLGSLLIRLGEAGVTDVCLCGAIDRPVIDPAALDRDTLPLVPLFQEALAKGDDGALRLVMQIFEQTGFTIRGADELVGDLTQPAGVPTKAQPEARHRADAAAGARALVEMGAADLGQASVIKDGVILAREDDAGTDAMLATFHPRYEPPLLTRDLLEVGLDQLSQWVRTWFDAAQPQAPAPNSAPGAVLFKAPKPDQDRRADLPTIGPATAMHAAEGGFDGIIIEAGGVMVLDLPRVVAILDAMGMFLWIKERGA
ncbi:UDP-2,3-diacylglucosamine diphosphatase LpxI [Litorivita sp. NS0012-18]|uniref:LpxI family protein n=1 Tax=Litorivita sp. NS0012-18 TaxID=3127655 RepID=UPI0031070A43